MPRPRAAKLETATARRKLAVRKKPYWTTISPRIHLAGEIKPPERGRRCRVDQENRPRR